MVEMKDAWFNKFEDRKDTGIINYSNLLSLCRQIDVDPAII